MPRYLTKAEAKPLLDKWRAKAAEHRKIEFLYSRIDSGTAKVNKLLADAYCSCADDLDQALGRIS
jgi:hypothetical protein